MTLVASSQALEANLTGNFKRLTAGTLKDMLSANSIDLGGAKSESDLPATCQRAVLKLGVDELFGTENGLLTEDQITQLTTEIGSDIKQALLDDLVGTILGMSKQSQSVLRQALDIAETTSNHLTCEQIYINGADAFLGKLSPTKLGVVAEELGVQRNSDDQDGLVDGILDIFYPPVPNSGNSAPAKSKNKETKKDKKDKEKKKKDEKKKKKDKKRREEKKPRKKRGELKVNITPPDSGFSNYEEYLEHMRKHRPPLKKGITIDDIQNCYWVEEIRAFCKDNGLKTAGKKAQLNRRVLQFVNEGVVDGPAAAKPAKSKKGAQKRKAEPKIATDAEEEESPAKKQKAEEEETPKTESLKAETA